MIRAVDLLRNIGGASVKAQGQLAVLETALRNLADLSGDDMMPRLRRAEGNLAAASRALGAASRECSEIVALIDAKGTTGGEA